MQPRALRRSPHNTTNDICSSRLPLLYFSKPLAGLVPDATATRHVENINLPLEFSTVGWYNPLMEAAATDMKK